MSRDSAHRKVPEDGGYFCTPGAGHAALHDMMVTQDYYAALPEGARAHLICRVVEKLVPITQKHQIEGLVMGVEQAAVESAAEQAP